MKMSKLSNQTNSPDPQAVNSRVFVGNLNTFQCSKTDVERMFQKYGRLAGISMHKGYAFVQFSNPFDARNACHGEDGRTVLSQILDVNMVAEPKPHQIGRKRQNVSKTGNDWDYYYDSYCTSTMFPTQSPRPIKRQRLMTPHSRGNGLVNGKVNSQQQQQQQLQLQLQHQQQQQQQQQMMLSTSPLANNGGGFHHHSGGYVSAHNGIGIGASTTGLPPMVVGMMHDVANTANGCNNDLSPFKVYSNPDTLVCGNCRECFLDLADLIDHKRTYCKLRFTCRCQDSSAVISKSARVSPTTPPPLPSTNGHTGRLLLCAMCKEDFASPWELMVHAQTAHMINIYELSANAASSNNNNNSIGHNNNMKTTGKEQQLIVGMGDDGGELGSDLAMLSPRSSTSKEDEHLFNHMSPSQHSSEGSKHGAHSTPSSRDSSPRPESVSPVQQECLVRALSIETAPTSSLGVVTSSLALTISNGSSSIVLQ